MDDRAFAKLLDFLGRVPGVEPIGHGDDGAGWWVKLTIDIDHMLAWNVVQEFGYVLNELSLTERLPTVSRGGCHNRSKTRLSGPVTEQHRLPIGALDAGHDGQVASTAHGRILTSAARAALRPLGLQQKGRSRLWFEDHGWWLLNVEFQPSAWATGSYLNIGEQHLWCERDHYVFERHERPSGGTAFVEFTADAAASETAIHELAELAVAAVQTRRREHGKGRDALRFVARTDDDFNAGVALGLLGDAAAAAERLTGCIHPAIQAQAAHFRDHLDDGAFEGHARAAVERTRSLMQLPPAEWTWRT